MSRRLAGSFAVGLVLCAFSGACASAPAAPPAPAWTQLPARTAENGYIIYVGTGEDDTLERAHFKASGMAIQDLVNECSLPPKGTRTEDSFESQEEGTRKFKSWVKVSIQYEDCEEAKKTVDPDGIRKLANAQLTGELKRYQQMIDEPVPEVLAEEEEGDEEGLNPALGAQGPPPGPRVGSGSVRIVAVNDYGSFFWARQQIAYSKQVVILAPPQQYQPGTPQTAAFIHQVAPAQATVQQYEARNPETRTWHQSYSGSPVRQQMIQQRAVSRGAAGPRRMNNRLGGQSRRQGGRGNGRGERPKRRKRRGENN